MVEQTNTGECHRHSVFVAHIDHVIVTDRSARLRDILYAALVGTFDIVAEWEEGVRAESHILHLVEPCAFFLFCEYRRFFGEYFLPLTVCENIHILVPDINVNGVVTIRTFDLVDKRKV